MYSTTFTLFSRSILLALFISASAMYSQEINTPYKLGHLKEVVAPFVDANLNLKSNKSQKFDLQITDKKSFTINIQSNSCKKGVYYVFGEVEGFQNASFFFKGDDNGIEGKLLLYDTEEAYSIKTNKRKEVYIKPVNIHSQVCIIKDKSEVLNTQKRNNTPFQSNSKKGTMPELESFPGAPGVLYLDFDGENVYGGSWGAVDASASGLTNEEIEEIFYIIAEDYVPFNINVTTIRSIYDNANRFSRQMIVFNSSYPNNPGVAILGSFSNGSGDPCWVRMGGPVQSALKAANVGSHEAGHTFGLRHDGYPSGAYYPGHSFYRVIMGTVTDGYSQFSRGEYFGANNQEDDLSIVSGATNGVGYRDDDYGNDITNSANLSVGVNGQVLEAENSGIIGKTLDVDLFKLEVGSGTIDLNIRPSNKYNFAQNLDVKVRLLDASGTEIANADPEGFDATKLSKTVTAGIYYLEVDGVGFGDISGIGYSDYGSLGQYFISGKVPPVSLSVNHLDEASLFEIFPNPANGVINIKHDFIQANYEIKTIHGAIIAKGKFSSNNEKVDVSFFAKGVYLFNVKTLNQIYTAKIIIK